ncbi:MAG: formate dehydrogenase accessory sulfurtransferase FdhD [Fusobacteriaceae bacterium]
MKNICTESPVTLFVNGEKILTFMCSPKNLEELGIGHLFSAGVLSSLDEIIGVGVSDNNSSKKISVIINKKISSKNNISENISSQKISDEKDQSFESILFSSCFSGSKVNLEKLMSEEKFHLTSNFSITKNQLAKKYSEMLGLSSVTKTSAGMHEAFLTDIKNINILHEDIGRHNAVDKVIGDGLKKKIDFENSMIIVTGRISSDMISKAVQAKIPIVVSMSVPSDLALEIADQVGICVIGRVKNILSIEKIESIIYTKSGRVKD